MPPFHGAFCVQHPSCPSGRDVLPIPSTDMFAQPGLSCSPSLALHVPILSPKLSLSFSYKGRFSRGHADQKVFAGIVTTTTTYQRIQNRCIANTHPSPSKSTFHSPLRPNQLTPTPLQATTRPSPARPATDHATQPTTSQTAPAPAAPPFARRPAAGPPHRHSPDSRS